MTIAPLAPILIEPMVRAALLEDLGRAGDVTTDSIVPLEARAETALVARHDDAVLRQQHQREGALEPQQRLP